MPKTKARVKRVPPIPVANFFMFVNLPLPNTIASTVPSATNKLAPLILRYYSNNAATAFPFRAEMAAEGASVIRLRLLTP